MDTTSDADTYSCIMRKCYCKTSTIRRDVLQQEISGEVAVRRRLLVELVMGIHFFSGSVLLYSPILFKAPTGYP